MIVTCPECSSQYLLPDDAIGRSRRVKCVNCAHVWAQVLPPEPETASGLSFSPYEVVENPAVFTVPSQPGAALLADMRDVTHPIVVQYQFGGMIARALLIAAIVVLLTAGLAALLRQNLVEAWPPAALLFEKAHLQVPPRGAGLAFSNVEFVSDSQGHDDISLSVSGNITNRTKHRTVLPDLLVTQQGGKETKTWPIGLRGRTIAPAQVLSFHYELKHALADTKQATVGFYD